MITLHIRFTNGQESFRTVYRVEIDKEKGILAVLDEPGSRPEMIQAASIRVYIGGQFSHTYSV